MLWTLQKIIEGAIERLSSQLIAYLPPLLAAFVIMAGAWVFATLGTWVFNRIFKGIEFDRWLRRTGVSTMLDPTGRRRARAWLPEWYWAILAIGFLTALNAFNTQLTTRMVEGVLMLLPRMAGALVIVVAGFWLAQYLGRGMLVWADKRRTACPSPAGGAGPGDGGFRGRGCGGGPPGFRKKRLPGRFRPAGGAAAAALAGGLAVGLGGREALTRYLRDRAEASEQPAERSLWTHL